MHTIGAGDRTVFSRTPPSSPGGAGTESIIHSLNGSDGCDPEAVLILGKYGILYGTAGRGAHSFGVVFSVAPTADGAWTFTDLYSFSTADGYAP